MMQAGQGELLPFELPPAVSDLLAHVPVQAAAKRDAVRLMGGADRFYHGLDHLAVLWRRHCRHAAAEGLRDPAIDALIASAVLFHDCIYDGARTDNEELSALHWLGASEGGALTDADRGWVADTIRATSAHLAYEPDQALADEALAPDAANQRPSRAALREKARIWFLDLDLTPLGEEPAAFDENARLLRSEVSHLSDAVFNEKRLLFLALIAKEPRIYRTATLAAAFEDQARRNIARARAGR